MKILILASMNFGFTGFQSPNHLLYPTSQVNIVLGAPQTIGCTLHMAKDDVVKLSDVPEGDGVCLFSDLQAFHQSPNYHCLSCFNCPIQELVLQ
jgi:hypothetical protein